MTDCRYKKKSRKVLKDHFWCKRYKKVVKDCSRWCYYRKPKSLFVWIKELFI